MIEKILFVIFASMACLTAVSSASPVVINEVELNPLGDAPLWVELYNAGDEDVDVSGWIIYISNENWAEWAGRMVIPNGTNISAGDFYVQEGETTWVNPSAGSVVLRTDADEIEDFTHTLTDMAPGKFAWSRYPDGMDTDSSEDWNYVRSTKGLENLPLK
jgi:hypothetical protein